MLVFVDDFEAIFVLDPEVDGMGGDGLLPGNGLQEEFHLMVKVVDVFVVSHTAWIFNKNMLIVSKSLSPLIYPIKLQLSIQKHEK